MLRSFPPNDWNHAICCLVWHLRSNGEGIR
jgi:hypothetical protein